MNNMITPIKSRIKKNTKYNFSESFLKQAKHFFQQQYNEDNNDYLYLSVYQLVEILDKVVKDKKLTFDEMRKRFKIEFLYDFWLKNKDNKIVEKATIAKEIEDYLIALPGFDINKSINEQIEAPLNAYGYRQMKIARYFNDYEKKIKNI